MALLRLPSQLPIPLHTTSTSSISQSTPSLSVAPPHHHKQYLRHRSTSTTRSRVVVGSSKEDIETELSFPAVPNTNSTSAIATTSDEDDVDEEEEEFEEDPDPQDLEYISQIKRVLELLKKNRDMMFSEVKLTVMIEDPREVERKRLLGIDDADTPTRDELAAVLEEVNEGKIPRDKFALQMLADEMVQWPNLEVEATKKGKRKSLYAKATDTGIDPEVAAKKLNIDWDTAAEIEEDDSTSDQSEVPSVVGYGALYLVTGLPVIIGVSVVLILFYNSLQ